MPNKTSTAQEPNKQRIYDLIEQITPLNNRYRDLIKGSQRGTEVLLVMWEVGSILEAFTKKNKIKPHNLYWRIYGKAEGIKTSYITRDFLSYCLRIKKYFKNSEDITNDFPRLQKYSLFREAFPLLENPKFKLSPDDENRIVNDLNSNVTPQKIKKMIVGIKAERIGVKNTRNQKLNEMKPITDDFLSVYNETYLLIKDNKQSEIDTLTSSLNKDYLLKLSQAVSALTQENLFIPDFASRNDLPENWVKFISSLKRLLSGSVELRNRFRRLFSPRKLFDLADMLNAFTTEQGVVNYRKRKMAGT